MSVTPVGCCSLGCPRPPLSSPHFRHRQPRRNCRRHYRQQPLWSGGSAERAGWRGGHVRPWRSGCGVAVRGHSGGWGAAAARVVAYSSSRGGGGGGGGQSGEQTGRREAQRQGGEAERQADRCAKYAATPRPSHSRHSVPASAAAVGHPKGSREGSKHPQFQGPNVPPALIGQRASDGGEVPTSWPLRPCQRRGRQQALTSPLPPPTNNLLPSSLLLSPKIPSAASFLNNLCERSRWWRVSGAACAIRRV